MEVDGMEFVSMETAGMENASTETQSINQAECFKVA